MSNDPILVVVFLRGGADGLNLISPTADEDYIAARPESMRVLRKGDGAGHAMPCPIIWPPMLISASTRKHRACRSFITPVSWGNPRFGLYRWHPLAF